MGKGRSQVVAAFGWGHSNTVITERSHGEKMGDSVVRTRALEAARESSEESSQVSRTPVSPRACFLHPRLTASLRAYAGRLMHRLCRRHREHHHALLERVLHGTNDGAD